MRFFFATKKLFFLLSILSAYQCAQAATGPRFLWIDPRDPARSNLSAGDLDQIRSEGINALLFPALFEGRIRYSSNLLPAPSNSWDLPTQLRLAREQGFEVGLYFQTFIHGGVPTDPSHIARLHPEWLSYRGDGMALKDFFSKGKESQPHLDGFFFDPGIPRVGEYLTGILTEALERFSPDWVVLDQVRYPFPEPAYEGTGVWEQPYGYHPIPRLSFKEKNGFDPLVGKENVGVGGSQSTQSGVDSGGMDLWNEERRGFVDAFVQRVHELLIASYPQSKLATVGHPDPFLARRTLFQDWPRWIERGWIQAAILPNHLDGIMPPEGLEVVAPSIRERIWLAGSMPLDQSPAAFLSTEGDAAAGWIFFENRPNGFEPEPVEAPPSESLVRTLNEDPVVVAQSEVLESDQVWEPKSKVESPRVYTAEIRALYGFDPSTPPFDRLNPEGVVGKLQDLGFNAVFGGSESEEMRSALKTAGIRRFGEYPVFVGKSYWDRDPSSRPITSEGEPYPRQSWYAPLDPHQPWLQEVKREALLERVKNEELDGIWLDFIRFPVFWEEVPPKLIETSFSPEALTAFQERTGIVPEGSSTREMADWILANANREWRRFRADTILGFVDRIAKDLEEQAPNTILGAFVLPWSEDDYGNAIYRIAGQDLDGFAKRVDILSPMLYSHQLGKNPSWIQQRVEEISQRVQIPVYPIVQCFDQPTPMREEEVEDAIRNGRLAPSQGVILFSQRHLETTQRWENVRKTLREVSPPSTDAAPLSTP
ncbi:MAG: family 10 glycosylhydrolase [Candidatus Omnitrophica bacterium]|nr:family 10 glycosylhydrolase [Candidatus Omnitrophota bacterium]